MSTLNTDPAASHVCRISDLLNPWPTDTQTKRMLTRQVKLLPDPQASATGLALSLGRQTAPPEHRGATSWGLHPLTPLLLIQPPHHVPSHLAGPHKGKPLPNPKTVSNLEARRVFLLQDPHYFISPSSYNKPSVYVPP